MNVNYLLTASLCGGVVAISSAAQAQQAGSVRKNFDDGWKFARFGQMPDGSNLAEPGVSAITAMASSQEAGNPAANAFDGDSSSRWCASGGSFPQSVAVDLQQQSKIASATIKWEQPAERSWVLQTSLDNKDWSDAASAENQPAEAVSTVKFSEREARYVRLLVKGQKGGWASVYELSLFNADGKPVKAKQDETALASIPSSANFDDSKWRSLNLPHDWGIEGPFRMDIENETGKLPWFGIGWYRKTVEFGKAMQDKKVYLDFDGVMSQPSVYVNGELAGEWKYGYNSFRVDITPFIKIGAKNTIAVRVNNLEKSSRWYPGGGIYRHVWLETAPKTHFSHFGLYVTTPKITPEQAQVQVAVELDNFSDQAQKMQVLGEIIDANGKVVASGKSAALELGKDARQQQCDLQLGLKNPHLWQLDKPYLYKLRTSLLDDKGKVVDSKTVNFGVRDIEWNAKEGFKLNGKRVPLQGVCNHHDLGPLGAAANTRGFERQIEIMKQMGVNSIRTSHNPPAPEFLDLCDKHGILVIDELFDCWEVAKKPNGYNRFFKDWYKRDVANFIKRDRNHPSIIAWSTGNEIPEMSMPDRHGVSRALTDEIKLYDKTRPVTAGSNQPSGVSNGFAKTIDVYGANYHLGDYARMDKELADMPIYASETSSCVSSRGEYFFPVDWNKSKGFFNFQVSSYDLYAPGWANRPDLQFEKLDEFPRVAGEYVWTGFDYLGEPTPYNLDTTNALNFRNPEERAKAMEEMKRLGNRAPSRSSYFGIVDLCGFPKDRYYIYQARWRPELPMAHILPHWNWPDRVGQVTPVHVYSSGDEAELFLNGKSLGKKQREGKQYRFHWDDVKYEPGKLEVVVTKGGKPWAKAAMETTDKAERIDASVDRPVIKADGDDLAYVTLKIVDAKGRMVPQSKQNLEFTLSGPGEIVAVCNGDATDHSSFQKPSVRAYNGMAQVIVRSLDGKPGKMVLKASSPDGLKAAQVDINSK